MTGNQIAFPERDIEIVTSEINTLTKNAQSMALMYIIEIGRRLTEAKEILPHGEWLGWLKEKVNYSKSTANNFMKIFEGYSADQFSLFGTPANSQALGNLPYTKALQLLAIPEDEREEFAAEHDAENISTRELDRLIKERDEALREAERAAEIGEALGEAEEELKAARTEVRELTEESEELRKNVGVLRESLDKARDDAKAAAARYDELKNNPAVPIELREKLREEAEAKAVQKTAAEIQGKVDEAEKRLEAANAEKTAALAKLEAIEKAEKQAKVYENPLVAKFSFYFEMIQGNLVILRGVIKKLEADGDAGIAEKLRAALKAFGERIASEE